MEIVIALREAFESVKCLSKKFDVSDWDFVDNMNTLSNVYISVPMGEDEIRGYVDSALRNINDAKTVFDRGDSYEDDLIGIHLDMALVNLRAAIYYASK
ncbi:hypothetical protein ASswx1_71 [Aeromonas phage Asswx_1]|uniref:Uncharacterized protein n=1 Tax=Aeromonas phage Asswx_1 TaxID=2419739 RepID=A0A411B836_9CAUD|nr:hypothetical protein ASswx1_71 [Aeromonas phage Asswx_1]